MIRESRIAAACDIVLINTGVDLNYILRNFVSTAE